MDVRITVTRGELTMTGFDKEFLRRFEAYMEENPEEGSLKDQGSAYVRFRRAERDLVDVVEAVMGKDADGPFTITISVDGRRRVWPTGPALY